MGHGVKAARKLALAEPDGGCDFFVRIGPSFGKHVDHVRAYFARCRHPRTFTISPDLACSAFHRESMGAGVDVERRGVWRGRLVIDMHANKQQVVAVAFR